MPASVVALFAVRFWVTALRVPPADGDLAWQRWLGEQILRSGKIPTSLGAETFTAAGSPWLPHEWLFATLAAAAQRAGLSAAFEIAVASCAVLALALLVRRASAARASVLGTASCVLFAGVAMLESFGVRAQVVGWPMLALFSSLLEQDASWLVCAAVAVAWANAHAGAVLAPVLGAAWAAGLAVRDRVLTRAVLRAWLVALATLFAVAVNPFGARLIVYATALVRNPVKAFIREWQPATFADASFVWGALPLLAGVAVWVLFEGRRSPQRLAAVALAVALLLAAARNVPLFALIVAPYAALGFTRVLHRLGAEHAAPRPQLAVAAASCVAVLAGVVAFRTWRAPVQPPAATRLIAQLAASPGPHRLLCQDYAWCGAAVGAAGIRVFLDGRADPYPLPVWDAAFRVAHRGAGWQRALRSYGVDAIVAERDTRLGVALRNSVRWRATGRSGSYELFVRSAPATKDPDFWGLRAGRAALPIAPARARSGYRGASYCSHESPHPPSTRHFRRHDARTRRSAHRIGRRRSGGRGRSAGSPDHDRAGEPALSANGHG